VISRKTIVYSCSAAPLSLISMLQFSVKIDSQGLPAIAFVTVYVVYSAHNLSPEWRNDSRFWGKGERFEFAGIAGHTIG
jgi:hypothetical protein